MYGAGILRLAALIGIGLCLVAASAAFGAQGVTREEFVDEADAFCAETLSKSRPVERRGVELLENEKWAKGARKMRRSVKILRGIRKVRTIPHPPADDPAVQKWIDGELRSLARSNRAWKAVGNQRFRRATRLFRKARRVHRRAHKPVNDFGFEVCA